MFDPSRAEGKSSFPRTADKEPGERDVREDLQRDDESQVIAPRQVARAPSPDSWVWSVPQFR